MLDLKMVNFLLGKRGYTINSFFMCLWDSRTKTEDWIKKVWPLRTNLLPGSMNTPLNFLNISVKYFRNWAQKTITELIQDQHFTDCLADKKISSLIEFIWVVQKFLGNKEFPNYFQQIEQFMVHFQRLGCEMNIKMHFLLSHLDHFLENLGNLSEEQGVRFHQNIGTMVER